MPKQLNNGRVTQALQRAFGFKGRYIPMLDEVIVPVYVIADPSPSDATRIVAARNDTLLSLDTEFAFVQVFNPLDSGVICMVTRATATTDAGKLDLQVAFFDTPATLSTSQPFFRDRRITGRPAVELREDREASANQGDKVARLQIDGAFSQSAAWEATSSNDPRQPLAVLGPGQGVIVQDRNLTPPTAVGSINVNWGWLEIPITEQNPLGGLP